MLICAKTASRTIMSNFENSTYASIVVRQADQQLLKARIYLQVSVTKCGMMMGGKLRMARVGWINGIRCTIGIRGCLGRRR